MSHGKCCFPDSNTVLNYVTHCLWFMTDAVKDWESYDIDRCFEMQWSTCRTHGLLWFWHDAIRRWFSSLHWRHNDHDGVSNHQPYGCVLNRLFRRRSKKKSKLRVTGLCVGNSPGPVNSPHKGPVTRKMFPFDDVIMLWVGNFIVHLPQAFWRTININQRN